MRTPVLAAVLLATATASACGRATPPRAPAPAGPPATPRVTAMNDGEALAALAALAPTGADWEDRLATLPEPAVRPVAVALLRAGDFACKAVHQEEVGCGDTERSFEPLAPEATLDDPCLRRVLAGWAVAQLAPGDVMAVADPLEALVRLPEPETELAEAAFAAVPAGADELRLRLIAAAADAGRGELADAQLPALSPAGRARALVELGREAALDHLGERPPVGVVAAALAGGLSSERALQALDLLAVTDLADREVAATVRGLVEQGDCAVAARASALLADAGDPDVLPAARPLASEAAAVRALCVAGHVGAAEVDAVLARLTGGDLELVETVHRYWVDPDVEDPDEDGDGDPYTTTTREVVTSDGVTAAALEGWLPTACDGATCVVDGSALTLGFGARADGTPTLDTITRDRSEGEGCGC